MHRLFLASFVALTASACAYRPQPTDFIHIVDSSADVRFCTRLGEVSPVVPTTPGFRSATDAMLGSTMALGGTHLLMDKRANDWLLVRGVAYRCGPGVTRETVVVRAKG